MCLTDSYYDSPPQEPAILTNASCLLDTRKTAIKKWSAICFIVCEGLLGLSYNNVRVARGTTIQEVRPEAGFKTAGFVQEKLVGPAVEKLVFIKDIVG